MGIPYIYREGMIIWGIPSSNFRDGRMMKKDKKEEKERLYAAGLLLLRTNDAGAFLIDTMHFPPRRKIV